eukprot:3294544-Rhodomonas_salina.1
MAGAGRAGLATLLSGSPGWVAMTLGLCACAVGCAVRLRQYTVLRACYGIRGTATAYGATGVLWAAQYCDSVRYGIHGTEPA